MKGGFEDLSNAPLRLRQAWGFVGDVALSFDNKLDSGWALLKTGEISKNFVPRQNLCQTSTAA